MFKKLQIGFKFLLEAKRLRNFFIPSSRFGKNINRDTSCHKIEQILSQNHVRFVYFVSNTNLQG